MAAKKWIGSVSGDPTTAGNWSPSGVPADGDDIVFDGEAVADLDGADQSAIEPATIRVYKSCSYSIGSRANPWKIGALLLELYLEDENGGGTSGPPTVAIDCTADPVTAIVHDARTQGEDGFACVQLRGTDSTNTLSVRGGSVAVGTMVPSEATTWAQIDVAGASSVVTVGYGATLTKLDQQDGQVFLNAAATTIIQDGGTLTTNGSGAIGTIEARGTLVANSIGTITTLNVAGKGFADFSKSPAARTVSNCALYGRDCRIDLDNNALATGMPVVALTNGIDLLKGARPTQVNSPSDLTMAFSTL